MSSPTSFFFYDLETSGVDPRSSRIMQFAGQRTDMDLNPMGEPVNLLVRLSSDVVPDPDAILITGITPQQTLQDGITEAAFTKQFIEEIATPGTIFVGFNTVRFDDEFMRFMLYRNFHDPYEWQWRDGRSRWDLLDVVRMTRALRPDGIKWPFDSKGSPTNRLELLTSLNGLDHENAHDALNDVYATIAIAKLLKEKQPKLFSYLLSMRDKKAVAELVESGEPFVYSSGKYPSEYEKTTVAVAVTRHPKKQGSLVYDLRHDPSPYIQMSPEAIAKAWTYDRETRKILLPVKSLQYNRCPAIAPFGVLDAASKERLMINMDDIKKHANILRQSGSFGETLRKALDILDKKQQTTLIQNERTVDSQLYDGFISDSDKSIEEKIREASPGDVGAFAHQLHDSRLKALLPLYKARNYPDSLEDEDRKVWEEHRKHMLMDGGANSKLAKYFQRLGELAQRADITESKQYLLEELQLYGQSIMPVLDEFES